jgi:hypothetical protein
MTELQTLRGVRTITDEEVGAFCRDGWVRLDGLVTRELAGELLDRAKGLMAAPDDGSAAARSVSDSAQQVDGMKQVLDVGAFYDRRYLALEGQEPFAGVAFSGQLGANVRRLMSRNVGIRYRTDFLACKMPAGHGGSDPTHWHQDMRFMPHDRAGSVNVWIALDEVTPNRGSLRFLTGSYAEGLAGWAEDLSTERPDLFERYEMSPPLHMHPGDATIHHSYTIHGAPANATEQPRWTYIISYFPSDVRYTGAPNPEHDGLGLPVGEPIDHDRFRVVIEAR